NTYIQVIDPAAFGGIDAYIRQTGWIARACRETPPAPGTASVRLPGERALALRRAGLAEGVALYPGIMAGLESWASKLKLPLPQAVACPPPASSRGRRGSWACCAAPPDRPASSSARRWRQGRRAGPAARRRSRRGRRPA